MTNADAVKKAYDEYNEQIRKNDKLEAELARIRAENEHLRKFAESVPEPRCMDHNCNCFRCEMWIAAQKALKGE